MDEKFFDPNYVPGAFIDEGNERMQLWRYAGIAGGKYLVVRRDGTVPHWPHFVLAAADPWAPGALRAYADAAQAGGADGDYVESIRQLATDFEKWREDHGQGDPGAGPHRTDDPAIAQVMRDCLGGRVFIAAAWDAEQVKREAEKEKQSPPWAE